MYDSVRHCLPSRYRNSRIELISDGCPVENAFSGEDGMLSKLDTMIEDYTKSGGLLAQREDELNQTIADVEARETENEAYLEQYEESLRQKYANLDTMISGYNTSLSYLSSVL